MPIHFPPASRTDDANHRSTFPTGDGAGKDEWSVMDCLHALYRRRFTLLTITGLGVAAALLMTAMAPRSYQSQATIEVQAANPNFLNLRDVYPTDAAGDSSAPYMQTQADLIQQDAMLEKVVRRLRLQDYPEFQAKEGVWERVRRLTGAAQTRVPPERIAVEKLRKDIKVAPAPNSRLIEITSEARSASLAANIANALARAFVEQEVADRQRAARQTYEAVQEQIGNWRPGGRSGAFYDALRQKANEARIASTLPQSNVRVAGVAVPPLRPHKPNLPLNLAIGLFGGLVFAVGLVMLQEQTKSVLRTPGEAGEFLTLPELGAIPMAPGSRLWNFYPPRGNGQMQVERISLEQRTSSLSEAFRTTLASILSSGNNGEHPRVLVVTSSQPMEGKTTVVSNLGIALAEISNRVLLIDGDMRRPHLHKVFDQANSWGLSDLLSEQNAIDELPLDVLVRKTAVPHLYLLPSGPCTDNIFGLLHSGRMARLLPRFREEFDYVLVDAPPCLEFADARIMARYAEQLMLVVRANHTDRKTVQAAAQRLQQDGIPVMGVILNRWDPSHLSAYPYPRFYNVNRQEPT